MNQPNYFSNKEPSYNIKEKAAIGAGLTVSTKAVNYVIATIATIILARLLVPDDFGLVTMVMTVSLLLRNFGVNGFTEAIIQEKNLNHSQVNSLFWIHLIANTSLSIIFLSIAPIIMWFYGDDRLKPIIYAMSITIVAPCFSTHHIALLQRNLLFSKFNLIELLVTITSSALGILMALTGAGYWAIVIRRSSIPIVEAISAWVICKWRPTVPKFAPNTGHLIRFALNTYGAFTTTYFSKNIDKILLGKYFGSVQLANYDRAYHLFLMPLNQLLSPLTNVALPLLSKLKSDPHKYIRYYSKSISILSLIGMLLGAIVTVTGKDIMILLLGSQWHLAGEVLSAFGPAIGVMLIYKTLTWLHLSLGNADRYFRWGLFSVVITVSFIVAGLRFGAVGIAIGYSLSFYFLILPGLWYALKPINVNVSVILKVIYKQAVSAVVAVLFCWYLKSEFEFTSTFLGNVNIFFRIAIFSTLCTSAYMASNIILHSGLGPTKDAINFLKEMMPKKSSK